MKRPVPKETGCRSIAVAFRGAPGWAIGEEAMPWAVPEYVPTSVMTEFTNVKDVLARGFY